MWTLFELRDHLEDANSLALCPLCGGNKSFGKTMFTVDLGFGVVVVRHVPAPLCELCGEDWIADDVAAQLEAIVEQARVNHAIVEVADWQETAAA